MSNVKKSVWVPGGRLSLSELCEVPSDITVLVPVRIMCTTGLCRSTDEFRKEVDGVGGKEVRSTEEKYKRQAGQ